jgi:hypothetical protein
MLAGFVTTGFFLWGYIKDSAYDNNPCNMDEQKISISDITADISPLVQRAGVHFQNFL